MHHYNMIFIICLMFVRPSHWLLCDCSDTERRWSFDKSWCFEVDFCSWGRCNDTVQLGEVSLSQIGPLDTYCKWIHMAWRQTCIRNAICNANYCMYMYLQQFHIMFELGFKYSGSPMLCCCVLILPAYPVCLGLVSIVWFVHAVPAVIVCHALKCNQLCLLYLPSLSTCVTCFQNSKKGEEELMIGQGKSSDKCHDVSLGV